VYSCRSFSLVQPTFHPPLSTSLPAPVSFFRSMRLMKQCITPSTEGSWDTELYPPPPVGRERELAVGSGGTPRDKSSVPESHSSPHAPASPAIEDVFDDCKMIEMASAKSRTPPSCGPPGDLGFRVYQLGVRGPVPEHTFTQTPRPQTFTQNTHLHPDP
jgi:hypothetical protein